jgi:hypothetical protein
MIDSKNLSPEAQKLIELTVHQDGGLYGHHSLREDVDLAAILQEHPELIKGLNEYTKWRDETMRQIEQQQTTQPVGHGISEVLKGLSKPGK